ncbi:MAG: hypothetical protein HY960_11825 [Ignavibacteriae bacterium]|nr:hypothetical protein [Ignavibacteriota bacterium]
MNTVERLKEIYQESPLVRGLAQLITPIAAVDAALTTHLQKLQEKKLRIFFDELGKGQKELSIEIIEEVDFLHAYFATVNAVLRAYRSEKIQLFARLLLNFGKRESLENYSIDEYEEYLAIIDELSWREIDFLIILADIEKEHTQRSSLLPYQVVEKSAIIREKLNARLLSIYHMTEDEIDSALIRIMRTGFYHPIVGGYGGGSFTNAPGKLTDSFYKFLERIKETISMES